MNKKRRLLAVLTVLSISIGIMLCVLGCKNNHIVVFDIEGTINTKIVGHKEKVLPPSNPNKEGYRFDGWYKDPFYNYPFDFNAPIKSDITLYAKFIKVYLVTFETFCEIKINSQLVDIDTRVKLSNELKRDGYIFTGWYCDENCTALFDFDFLINDNITLYAGWQREYYFLNFDTCGAAEIPAQKVRFDSVTQKPSDPIKEGKQFGGWFWDKEYKYKFEFGNPLLQDITIYACWLDIKPTVFELIFYVFYPNIYHIEYLEKGSLIYPPDDPKVNGYKFAGWFADRECTTVFEFGKPINQDAKIFAKFLAQKQVRFFDGNQILFTQYIFEGEKANPPVAPEKEGYIFDKWYKDNNLTEEFNFESAIFSDTNIFAGYIKTIKYQFFDGSELLFEGQVSINSKINRPSDPVKEGYEFLGWYCDSDFTTQFDFSLPLEQDTKIYARFIKKITIRFFVDNNLYFSYNALEGDNIRLPNQPNKENYVFKGWFTLDGKEIEQNEKVLENLDLYAKFFKLIKIIVYIDDSVKIFIFEEGQIFDQQPPNKEGYKFLGWFLDAEFTRPFDENQPLNEDFALYAKFEALPFEKIKITIVFDENQSQIIEINYGTNVVLTEPIDEQKVFVGWFSDYERKLPFDFSKELFEDTTIYGLWREKQNFSVTFLDFDGSVIEKITAKELDKVLPPVPQKRNHYEFLYFTNYEKLNSITDNLECFAVYKYNSTDSNEFIYIDYLDGYLICAINSNQSKLILPSEHNNKRIYGIADTKDGIWTNKDITYIFIPYEYIIIGDNAFKNCISLTEIEFDRKISLEKIGQAAFSKTSIKKLCFSESKENLILDKNCFYECNNLQEIILNTNVFLINDYAFYQAGKNKDVYLYIPKDSKLCFVGNFAFYKCNLTNCKLIAPNLEYIGKSAFYYSDFLSIQLVNIVEIGDKAFYPKNAPDTISLENLPDIKRNLDKIVLGKSLKHVGSYNFCFIKDLCLPENIENIGEAAFLGASIKKVTLNNLKNISLAAFAYSNISSLIYDADTDLADYLFYKAKIKNYIISGEFKRIGTYTFFYAEVFGEFALPKSIKEIGQFAFSKSLFEKLVLPDSLENIGVFAFAYMPNLLDINIPVLVNQIPNSLFEGCVSLNNIDIEGKLISIGSSAFKNTAIKHINLPDSLAEIGKYAFSHSQISIIKLSHWLEKLDFSAFENCLYLEKIFIPKDSLDISFINPDYLSYETFKGFEVEDGNKYFSSLTGDIHLYNAEVSKLKVFIDCKFYSIPDTLLHIEPYQFAGKYSLESVSFGKNLISIGAYAFAGSKDNTMNLKNIDFSAAKNLTTIEKGAFSYNLDLIRVDLSACIKLTVLPEDCFLDCENLEEIFLPLSVKEIGINFLGQSKMGSISTLDFSELKSLEKIGDKAFANQKKLTAVKLPNSIQYLSGFDNCVSLNSFNIEGNFCGEIGKNAFYNCANLTNINFAYGAEKVGDFAFAYSGAKEFIATNNLSYIGSGVFYNANNLSIVDLKNSKIKNIFYQSFSKTTLLKHLTLPDVLENIEELSFAYSGLRDVAVPSSVVYIGDGAFSKCAELTTVEIGNLNKGSNILLFGAAPFESCLKLQSIYIYSFNPPSVKVPSGGIANTGIANGFQKIENLKIFVPFSSLVAYKNAVNNSLFDPLEQKSWSFHVDQLFGF